MEIYERLGVRRVVNAATTLTALGGTAMAPEAVEAMVAASRSSVDLVELQQAAGRRLAELTRNEAALVTVGCAAAITLAVLGAATEGDPKRIALAPLELEPRRVIMHVAHRIPYDRAVELAGAEIVEIGNAVQTFEWELELALEKPTAAFLFVAGSYLPQHAALDLALVIEKCHARKVPVIVDAAAQLPPVANLWHFTAECGADLAVFSGGKALRGPQASGLMLGRAALVNAAAANATPLQRLARALKVGKEEICGLVAAVERYLSLDHQRVLVHFEAVVRTWCEALAGVPGVQARRGFPNQAGQPIPRLVLELGPEAPCSAAELQDALWAGDPRIAVLPGPAGVLYVSPDTLAGEVEEGLVIDRIMATLEGKVG